MSAAHHLPLTSIRENAPTPERYRPYVEWMRTNLLQQILRISIKDGRVFLGTFVGTDHELNIILTNAEEYRTRAVTSGRYVGMILIPWRHVIKAEVRGEADADVPPIEDLYT